MDTAQSPEVSPTGATAADRGAGAPSAGAGVGPAEIVVRGARTHNLRTIDCHIPHHTLTVITGVSGSGKSSLAFDTIYAEGQRRYLATFSSYARQFLDKLPRPPVDALRGIQPSIALRQHNGVTQPRSTLATVTELADYLALLYTAIGQVWCPGCDRRVEPTTPSAAMAALLGEWRGWRAVLTAPVAAGDSPAATLAELAGQGHSRLWVRAEQRPHQRAARHLDELAVETWSEADRLDHFEVVIDRLRLRSATPRLRDSLEQAFALGDGVISVYLDDGAGEGARRDFFSDLRCDGCGQRFLAPVPPLFSFNTSLGACPVCTGFGRAMGIVLAKVVPEPERSLRFGAIEAFEASPRGQAFKRGLEPFCQRHGIPLDRPWCALTDDQRRLIVEGDGAFTGVLGFFDGLERARKGGDAKAALLLSRYRGYTTCVECQGTRLSTEARAVRVGGRHPGQLSALTVRDLRRFLDGLELDPADAERADVLPSELKRRLRTLEAVGLGYLTLDRQTRTLSTGEYQRAMLATCIGRGLVDTCYVLDEPTVGLHARDTDRLVSALCALRDEGNTVIVVEHDPLVIEAADYLVELGPGGGERGGRLLFEGLPGVRRERRSDGPGPPVDADGGTPLSRRQPEDAWLVVEGARRHNLDDVEVQFPLGCLTAVTGVSGSGKSTLVFGVLLPELRALRRQGTHDPRRCRRLRLRGRDLEGLTRPGETGDFGEIVAVERRSSGLTSRSTLLTYSGLMDRLRKLLAETPLARQRGYSALHFSTNVRGGRCETCQGMGVRRVDMHFMADVEVPCESCGGRRYRADLLEVELAGHSLADIQEMTVEQAATAFAEYPTVSRRCRPLLEVGLGYLRLGQPTQTLSGGELQRLHIAQHLERARERDPEEAAQPVLFLFDEPTTGLHERDVAQLLTVLWRLRDDGHTVIVVEHNLQLIEASDWVIDLGPEGGEAGGTVVVAGPPEVVAREAQSHTGRFLSGRGRGAAR